MTRRPNAQPGRRDRLRLAGRVLLSVSAALGVAVVASRVNRPQRWRVLEEVPRVGDARLAEVSLDLRSPADAVAAVERAAPGRVRLDPELLDAGVRREGVDAASVRLRDVRLGTAVALAVEPWAQGGESTLWEAGGKIVVGPAGRAPVAAVEARIYDVRDLVRDVTAWSERLDAVPRRPRPAYRPAAGGGGSGFGASGPMRGIAASTEPAAVTAANVAELIQYNDDKVLELLAALRRTGR